MSPTMKDLRALRNVAVDDSPQQRLARVERAIRRGRRRRIAGVAGGSAALAAGVAAVLLVALPDSSVQTERLTPAHTPGTAAPTAGPSTNAPTATTDPSSHAVATATATASSTDVAWCATADLRLTLGAPSGAAGSAYYPLQLRNAGSAPCRTGGYPGVSFLDANHQQVGPAADRQPPAGTTLVLAPGATATATLRVVNAGNYPAATCAPGTASYVRVFPPDNTAALDVARQLEVCTRVATTSVTALGTGG